jgi:hypothetical protein
MGFLNRHRGRPARSRRLPSQSPRNKSRRLLFETCESRDLFAADLKMLLWHDFDADGVRDIGDHGLRGGVAGFFWSYDAGIGNGDDCCIL